MPNRLLVALDKLIWKIDKVAKICKSINGKLLATLSVFVVCCTIVSFLGTDTLKSIPVFKSTYYDTVVVNCPGFVDFLSAPVGKFLFTLIFVSILVCYILRKFYRPWALLMTHSTMGHDLSRLDQSFKKSFWFKRANIGSQLPSQNALKEQVIAAIHTQDDTFKNIHKKNWCSTIFYYGVAHTPLVFRLGYQVGQIQRVRFLHRFRPTEDTQEFKELPEYNTDKVSWHSSDIIDEEYINSRSQQILVSLASTYPIKSEDLDWIDPDKSMLRYNIQVDMMGYDFFSSYHKIRSYGDRIIDDVRKIVKERRINTIHMVISSSVPFTFYLGQQMHTQQFPQIIVYHYDRRKYTWGVDIAEPNAEKAVIWIGNA